MEKRKFKVLRQCVGYMKNCISNIENAIAEFDLFEKGLEIGIYLIIKGRMPSEIGVDIKQCNNEIILRFNYLN